MSDQEQAEFYTVTPGGAFVSLHAIYCDCERCEQRKRDAKEFVRAETEQA